MRKFNFSCTQYADSKVILLSTTDTDTVNITDTDVQVLHTEATDVEAFFEGAQNVYEDAPVNFASKKIVIREFGTAKQTDPGNDATAGAFSSFVAKFQTNAITGSKAMLGLQTYAKGTNETVQWVDELNPPVKVSYDEINQRLQFTVDRTVLGTGTDSNFNSFTVYGKGTATDTNNLGLVGCRVTDTTNNLGDLIFQNLNVPIISLFLLN